MANNTFTLQNIDKVNFYGIDSGADVYLEGVSTGTSGVCVRGSLLVNGDYMNFGNTLGTDGYGFNSDSGTIKFKHSGGNWTLLNGGGGGGTPSGNETDIQFNDGGSFGGVSALQFHKSTTSGVSALTVDGNVFSSMGVCDATSQEPTNIYQLTTNEYVNGVVFLPYNSNEEEQFHQVRVPSATSVSTDFEDVLKPGQFFDTILYGTSTGVCGTADYPVDISVLMSSDGSNRFDSRLIRNQSGWSGAGLSFNLAEINTQFYQGVVIRSLYNSSSGISMYPISTSFYTN